MNKEENLYKIAVLFVGATIYALLYALCSQIDAFGTVSATTVLLR